MKHLRPLLAGCLLTALAPSAFAIRYYVNPSAAPGGDGLTWGTAFDSLDDALSIIVAGDRIWVAEGTYVPTIEQSPGDPRSVTFLVPAGVHLYGAFLGTEQTLAARAGSAAATILSGEIGAPGMADNANHVLSVRHPSGIPPGGNRVDGFTICRGNAGGGDGGGVLAWNVGLRLENVIVCDNGATRGAGIHAQPGELRISNSVIRGNRAVSRGGGLWSHATNIKVQSTRFEGNSAAFKGGAIYLHSSIWDFESNAFGSCVFHDNRAEYGGGAYVGGGSFALGLAVFKSCTFARNRAAVRGGAVHATTNVMLPARVWLWNSIVHGNNAPVGRNVSGRAAVAFSNVQGAGYSPAFGNLSVNPEFVDIDAGDLRLAPGSPCTDAGDNGLFIRDFLDVDGDGDRFEPAPFDVDGDARFQDDPLAPDVGSGTAPLIDMGAHERPGAG